MLVQSDTTQEQTQTTLDEIVTPEGLVNQHPDKFKLPQLNWWLRNRERNGLQACGAVSMRGRKPYINKAKFANWLMSQ